MAKDIHWTYTSSLRNTHAMEKQPLEQLERQLDRLERFPDSKSLPRQQVDGAGRQWPRTVQR